MEKLQARSLQVGVPDRRKSSIDEGEFRLVYTESKNLKNLYGDVITNFPRTKSIHQRYLRLLVLKAANFTLFYICYNGGKLM